MFIKLLKITRFGNTSWTSLSNINDRCSRSKYFSAWVLLNATILAKQPARRATGRYVVPISYLYNLKNKTGEM